MIYFWDYELNKDINPETIPAGRDNESYFWKCPDCNAKWSATPYNQSRSKGCRECVKASSQNKRIKTIISETGSFAENHPCLLDEWMYEKNAKLGYFPDKLTEGSRTEVWRKCSKCGHEFLIPIKQWVKGQECKYCKSIVFTHKEFVENTWDHQANSAIGLFPENFTYGSEVKVFCKCPNGHSIPRQINVAINSNGCPECNKHHNTSLTERCLLLCLKKSNINVVGSKRFLYLKNSEIDIFLPDYNIAINYDGSHFHKDQIDLDTNKTSIMKENGLYVIRIRETPLPDIISADKNISVIFPTHGNRAKEMIHYINSILEKLYVVLGEFGVKYNKTTCTEKILNSCHAENIIKK